jgi:glyoxylase-like metal-dependent hydrolase (beta-lactamase superfamily II)
LIIKKYVLGPVETNCYLLCDEASGKAVIIDPGDRCDETIDFISKNKYKVLYIINTHGHFDHICGNKFFHNQLGAPVAAHKLDFDVITNSGGANVFGLRIDPSPAPTVDLSLSNSIVFGGVTLEVIWTPGHRPGHVSLYEKVSESLFCGDVLFYRSVGRTDLPGGNHEELIRSIQQKLFKLPGSVVVYPGHGPKTTIADEMAENPWAAVQS